MNFVFEWWMAKRIDGRGRRWKGIDGCSLMERKTWQREWHFCEVVIGCLLKSKTNQDEYI